MISFTNIMSHLEIVAPVIPFPIYWANTECRVLGANQACINAMGAGSFEEVLGKAPHEYYPKELADGIVGHVKLVLETKKTLIQEDVIQDISTGKKRYYAAIRSPLMDLNGEVIGVIGTSIETTAEKEADYFKYETEKQKITLDEQEKFRQNADKVAHDIRSPLASLLILAKVCTAIPEKERIALREAATSISDIANNLLSCYPRNKDENLVGTEEAREPILISPVLLQMLTEKKYQYQGGAVSFDYNFSQVGEFSWVHIQLSAFKRTISNIINNAVDAFDQKAGRVTVGLDADEEQVRVTIEDNGKGMNSDLIQKIVDEVVVSEGKVGGHGIGLTQVRETLENNQGRWEIQSQFGTGTKITLKFPRTLAQPWIAENVQINDADTIIILDDDTSIHLAWDLRFKSILEEFPKMNVKHFEIGQDTVDFINGLDPIKKNGIFLLTDYELLKQTINGLDIIEQTKIQRSILVTSHYAHKNIQSQAIAIGTKILPKQLASDIPILVTRVNADETTARRVDGLMKPDAIFVDDEECLLMGFKMLAGNKQVDTYQNPREFLDKVQQYHKHTKIMLDQNFANYAKKGVGIAKQLHELGFTRLYLLSGASFSSIDLPSYVTPIMKTDIEMLQIALNE